MAPKGPRLRLCPACGDGTMDTKDTRPVGGDAFVIRRRRKCQNCGYACTTHETIVGDSEGFANAQRIAAVRFLRGVEALAKECFGDERGFLLPEIRRMKK